MAGTFTEQNDRECERLRAVVEAATDEEPACRLDETGATARAAGCDLDPTLAGGFRQPLHRASTVSPWRHVRIVSR